MEQIIKIALATIFGLAALAKLSGKTKVTFENSGYSHAFMYATAFAEVLFSVGLFTQYDLWAEIGLLTIIVGAIVTLIHQHVGPAKYGLAVLSLVLLLGLLVLRMSPRLNSGETRASNNHERATDLEHTNAQGSLVALTDLTKINFYTDTVHWVIVKVGGHWLIQKHFKTRRYHGSYLKN